MDYLSLAHDERADLADLLATLTEEQWETRTLCTRWSVRELVAHVISYDDQDWRGLLARFAAGRLLLGRVNDVGVADYDAMSTSELLEAFRARLKPRGLTAAFGGKVALTDCLIHHQDIRRPLGLPRTIPAERLHPVLRFAYVAPPIRGFWHVRGLRMVASDPDWSIGRGPEVTGPAEAVLMAMAGRGAAVDDLSGPGWPTLSARLRPT